MIAKPSDNFSTFDDNVERVLTQAELYPRDERCRYLRWVMQDWLDRDFRAEYLEAEARYDAEQPGLRRPTEPAEGLVDELGIDQFGNVWPPPRPVGEDKSRASTLEGFRQKAYHPPFKDERIRQALRDACAEPEQDPLPNGGNIAGDRRPRDSIRWTGNLDALYVLFMLLEHMNWIYTGKRLPKLIATNFVDVHGEPLYDPAKKADVSARVRNAMQALRSDPETFEAKCVDLQRDLKKAVNELIEQYCDHDDPGLASLE